MSQRLKRANRIVEKLVRAPSMRLSQMQDVGGCRVVVSTLTELRALQSRILDRYSIGVKVDDYISTPKKSGYRAVHVMAVFHGHVVEIQLRTEAQHAWATVVESAEMSSAKALREGEGPPQVLDLLREWAEGLAHSPQLLQV